MLKENLIDLYNFMIVAEEASFTKAAVKLGVTQSALSHSLKGFENRIGNKLLERTTRRVGLTATGKILFDDLYPCFTDIEDSLHILESENDSPVGIIKLAATEIAAHKLLWPVLSIFLKNYPHVKVEVDIFDPVNQSFSDFDAIIEIGESVYKGRKTISISNKHQIVTVAAPLYVERYGEPKTPTDLNEHKTIGVITPVHMKKTFWQFNRSSDEIIIQNEFALIFNTYSQLILAVKGHAGIAHLPKLLIQDELASGKLKMLLTDWYSYMPGFYIHYSANQPNKRILSNLITALQNYAMHEDF
ncbi:LysR family transcriptional regulator [uncultured Tolumonas sp.]|uniref:LysR family transcriptional regulator n=1 Tax=uncultured Tolumonas sp. TaxID=263765 RepID=UPI002931D827|nr:LysR family transcriptional regulator [uncultured Tolumonas sp.]